VFISFSWPVKYHDILLDDNAIKRIMTALHPNIVDNLDLTLTEKLKAATLYTLIIGRF